MNFLTLYVTLVYTILSVYSDIEPRIQKEYYYNLHENNSQANHNKFHEMPEYDDQLPDFPHKQLEEEQNPFHKLSEVLNSGSVVPLWLVNPIYYVLELFPRAISYYFN
ncbi:MEG-4 (10.3) family [Schistosoma mansoni]|uniref:MEG-4 (10.3) family n=1 Tax=Schistosoma mansoni TaxID=6183 RepID=C4QKE8_SCHMA|nr:MEG-4 (10.3) family [Schistosoma mansoni]|eukprot:XP_018644363.1 MEG-4 (10.3) family [Schistosoma mansoni]